MRYLFFDIECADGEMAICEFGFVLCNERFEIIAKKNILMNPECKMHLTGRPGQKDLVLTYPEEEYLKHITFEEAYDNIKFLMTQKDLLIFGHGVDNDIRFIFKDCNRKRYQLPLFDYVAYDIQKMFHELSKKHKKFTSLDTAFRKLVPEDIRNKLKAHRAEDDAYKTMLIFKAMCEELEFSVEEMIEACPKSRIAALEYWKQFVEEEPLRQERKRARKEAQKKKEMRAEGQAIWRELCTKHAPLLEDTASIGKIFFVSAQMKENTAELKNLVRLVEDHGYVAYNRINGSDFLIVFDEKDKERLSSSFKHPYNGKIITYQDFANMCEAKVKPR